MKEEFKNDNNNELFIEDVFAKQSFNPQGNKLFIIDKPIKQSDIKKKQVEIFFEKY